MRLSRFLQLLFAGSAVATGASAAQAATTYSWTGVYAGINVDYARGDAKADFSPATGFEDATDFKSNWSNAGGGAQVGYNYQNGSIVLGAEADFDYLGKSHHEDANYASGSFPFVTDIHDQFAHEIEWFGTARARVGVAASDTLLLYGTGGLAFGDVKSAYLHEDTGYTTSQESGAKHETKLGWTAGAGAELALSDRWSVKGEYLHVDLGHTDFAVLDSGVQAGAVKVEDDFDTVRVGLNYKF